MKDYILNKKAHELTFKDFAYLSQPPAEVQKISHDEKYIFHKRDKKLFRKIYENTPFDEYEISKIQELKEEINKENIHIPENWTDAYLLKMCYSGNFKLSASIKLLKNHLEWINNPKFHCLTEESLQILKNGIIYSYGTDKLLRPIVILNVYKIDMKNCKIDHLLSAFCFLLSAIEKNMFHPGKIENWVILIDVNNMSLWNVPLKALAQVIDCMSNNYPFSLERLYILNPSSSLSMIWKMIEAMMDEITKSKIKFLKKDNFFEINEYIESHQLEEKYGGDLKDLSEFWPPKNIFPKTNNESFFANDAFQEKPHENLNEIFGKNEDFYGAFALTRESQQNNHIKNNSDDCSVGNQSRYQSLISENARNTLLRTSNLSISKMSKIDSKYVSFVNDEVYKNKNNDEVFYSIINRSNDQIPSHYRESLVEKNIEKSHIINQSKDTTDMNDSCACRCTLI